MIKKETLQDGSIKIYSDCGKRVKKVETNEVLPVAYEAISGKHYTYEEVE